MEHGDLCAKACSLTVDGARPSDSMANSTDQGTNLVLRGKAVLLAPAEFGPAQTRDHETCDQAEVWKGCIFSAEEAR